MKTLSSPQDTKLNVRRLTVYLDPVVDERFRRQAEVEDRSLSTVAEKALRLYLACQSSTKEVSV